MQQKSSSTAVFSSRLPVSMKTQAAALSTPSVTGTYPGGYDPARRARDLLPTASRIVQSIFGNIKAPPGYGDSVTAVNLARNRADQVLSALYHLMNQDQWAQNHNQRVKERYEDRYDNFSGNKYPTGTRYPSGRPYSSQIPGFHIINPEAIAAGPPGTFMGEDLNKKDKMA